MTCATSRPRWSNGKRVGDHGRRMPDGRICGSHRQSVTLQNRPELSARGFYVLRQERIVVYTRERAKHLMPFINSPYLFLTSLSYP
jgi:hypothetical protein